MNNADLDEDCPIYKAIDRGGGQTCDIAGVLRELGCAGFAIVNAADLLSVRNALIAGDVDEAYHQLRMLADPTGSVQLQTGDHWTQWEKIAEAAKQTP